MAGPVKPVTHKENKKKDKPPVKEKPVQKLGDFDFMDEGARCTCCGKNYSKKRGNFLSSKSPIYAANQGYVSICRACTEKMYNNLVEYFRDDEEKAAERMSQIFDWFWDVDIWNECRNVSADRTKILAYPSKMNLTQHAKDGSTYFDTIRLRTTNRISNLEEFEDMKDSDKIKTTRAQFDRWGSGYSPDEYDTLDSTYKSLKDIID